MNVHDYEGGAGAKEGGADGHAVHAHAGDG